MEGYKYIIKLDNAIMKFDYDRVKELILYYPDNAKDYLMNHRRWISCVTDDREESIYTEKSEIIIDILKLIFDKCTFDSFVDINDKLLKWAVDTINLDIIKCVLGIYKKFNIQPPITELLNDDNDDFFDITDEILHYFVKRHKEFGVMKISKYYGYFYNMLYNRLANMGVEPIEIILI